MSLVLKSITLLSPEYKHTGCEFKPPTGVAFDSSCPFRCQGCCTQCEVAPTGLTKANWNEMPMVQSLSRNAKRHISVFGYLEDGVLFSRLLETKIECLPPLRIFSFMCVVQTLARDTFFSNCVEQVYVLFPEAIRWRGMSPHS